MLEEEMLKSWSSRGQLQTDVSLAFLLATEALLTHFHPSRTLIDYNAPCGKEREL